ncbi:MAG: carbohydrate ABC transporter permease, partial [Clostridia bacterium]|nr:carbohydrate ABC transporter permease [Clostridia bacterium]
MRKGDTESNSFARINRIRPGTNALFTGAMSVIALATVIPVILVFIISITSSESLTRRGFSFFPLSV